MPAQLGSCRCVKHAGRRASVGSELVPDLPQLSIDLGILPSSTLAQFVFGQQMKLQLHNLRLVMKQPDEHVEREVTTSSLGDSAGDAIPPRHC